MGMFLGEQRRGVELKETSLQPGAGRVPPHDLDAEAAVLSAVLLSPEDFATVAVLLAPHHFYSDANRRIYEAICDLQTRGTPADVVTVATWLNDKNRLQQVGGTVYLAQLADATPAVANLEAYARTVREKWRVRQLIQACQRYAAEGYGDYGDVQAFIDAAEQAIFEIARMPTDVGIQPVKKPIEDVFKIITDVAKRGGGISGVPTGFERFDQLCGGLHPGDLYVVGGRPGTGKTAFILNVAVNVASHREQPVGTESDPYVEAPVEAPGCGVAFFSLEMPREQLASRLLATEARVDLHRIRGGKLGTPEWTKLTEAAARLSRLPIWIDDTPALTLLELRAKVRRLQAELKRGRSDAPPGKLGLVVVDYLQLMQGRRDASSREQEISELSRGLKQLAKEMRVPMFALSQLNRAVETRGAKDGRPQLSDLRESGAIEQDADLVVFIYRKRKRGPDDPDEGDRDRGVAEMDIAKQRNGPVGHFQLKFTESYTRFDNLARGEEEYDEYDEYDKQGQGPYG